MTLQFEPRPYPLSIADAARVAHRTPGEIRDLVASKLLSCLVLADAEGTEWFNAEDVRVACQGIEASGPDSLDYRRALQAGAAIRKYLEKVPPVADYDDAIERNAPLLAKTKKGRIFAHIQPEVACEFIRANSTEWPLAELPTSLRIALKAMGALKVRGIRGLTGGEQRWHYWYRLPQTTWSAAPELGTVLQNLAGMRDEGEKMTRREGGEAELADPINPVD